MLEDLGQVLKMSGAKRMYTTNGHEVRSFSQLRNEFAEVDTFYLGTGTGAIAPMPVATGSPVRRSRSRGGLSGSGPVEEMATKTTVSRQRARSKSRPRVLYAPESEIVRPAGGMLLVFYISHTYTQNTRNFQYSVSLSIDGSRHALNNIS